MEGLNGKLVRTKDRISELEHSKSPASVAQLVGCHYCRAKGSRFDSQSGHMPGLQV